MAQASSSAIVDPIRLCGLNLKWLLVGHRGSSVDLPNIPTDNLYKFVTLASAAVFCFSIWQEDSVVSEYSRSSSILRANNDSLAFQIDIMKDKTKYFEELIKEDLNEKQRESIIKRWDKIRAESDEIVNRHADNIKNLGKANFESDRVIRLTPIIYWARYGSIATFFLGIFFWYFNHQRYQDASARNEAQKQAVAKRANTKRVDRSTSDPPP